MKKIILSLVLAAFSVVVVAQQRLASTAKPLSEFIKDDGSFSWTETSFDFGKIKVNKPVTHEFSFINAGDAPLVITSVQASCGCTVAKYSKDAIAPGSSGYVTATYNAARVGVFSKTVTVNANTGSGAVVLTVKGEVVE
jgi:hypothetical protein